MDKIFNIEIQNSENKYIVANTITLRLPEEKYEELIDIAIEVNDTIDEVVKYIVNSNLIDKIDCKDFKEIFREKYFSRMRNC
ncbi:hypothetical protein [Caproiciproducens sp. MSJ-32]|uniref:hypothetical protein n=1 Tax=Caproiciproducens sp. MSJ-32 TaxID=2841527 RepID=UPI001C101386|nr:hypothetical protein [Caproiciproducens sp. MSJ-32]MBU5454896.1 hypothetical protein [Caproiciproducens sp. MSJ-32]